MTFVPTPKADLQPLSDLYEGWNSFSQQVLSRLWHAEQAADWAAAQIADLYAEIATLDADWLWGGSATGVDPGEHYLRIAVTTGNERVFALSTVPLESQALNLSDLGPGTTIVLTDDPSTPPPTAFRQYVITSDPVDHGSWVGFDAVRVATFGTQTTPPVDSRVRLLIR